METYVKGNSEKKSIHVSGLFKGSLGPPVLWEFVLPLGTI